MAESKNKRPAKKQQTPKSKKATKTTPKKQPKKNTQPRKKTSSKKKPSWLAQHWKQLAALVGVLMSLIAISHLGLLGKLLANMMRWMIGGTYQVFLLVLIVPLLVVVAYNQWPRKFTRNQYIGFGMFYAGLCLAGSILLFSKMNVHIDLMSHINTFIQQDINNRAVSTPVGGGMLGAALYQLMYVLMGNFGSWLLAILCMLGGGVMLFNIPLKEVFDNFFNLAEGTGDYVQVKANNVHETVSEKVTDYKTRQKHAMNDVFQDDPFGAMNEQQTRQAEQAGLPDATLAHLTPEEPVDDDQAKDVEPEVTSTEFKMPEIVAPAPHEKEPDVQMAQAPSPTEVAPLPSDEDEPPVTLAESDFNADEVVQNFDQPVEPVTYGDEAAAEQTDEPLTHADILGQAVPQAASTQNAGAVGHVEPKTTSEPVADVDASGLGTVIDDAHYQLPSTDLLTEVGSTDQTAERDALNEKARILHETLKSFHINATVEKVVLGPTVTQYEIKPAVGVKVSKIQNLADDLALSLSAKSLRIEAPIPGKNVVGIEVANDQQATVGFKDMVEEAGIDTKHPLTVPIGRGVTSGVVKMDLTKMPHLLIAGSTGSGKSVAINGILASILLQAKPSQVRLMLVDPKKVELSVYNDIPHLITPVVSDPKKAALGLKKVVAEMDRRFKLLADEGVRNIDGYNRYVEKQNAKDPSTQLQTMPYLVVVIDELADLMMTSSVSSDVENAIVRIAQLGRAAGIHMIVATQRPSVDIITGLIKANVPSRMAFAVSSGVDSRTILDQNGAEKLLGRGDMLFAPIGASGPQRVQGAFISDEDVENLTDFIKEQGEAQYDESMAVSDAEVQSMESGGDGSGNELDELWDDVLEFVLRAGGASTSSIQRHFKIGYNRAGRIIDDMSDRGLVGPQNGSKPREINFTAEMLPSLKRSAQAK
ncbi:S-DNA-T family DNA segregation ATPase FtsK/SpoIIIE [Weissella uvarum]|uniref:DNA translocase FtsK n=1 Tax=Weissella uvarum TaxID=1479233 RepID=UPI00196009BB|nr:DNA translocase FtsK [Weissella uvarum]MBM7618089.1 S-DNA-T family DNA segregation ATPase FtsK/SpoIIIE [Weissella uvarum]MCM0595924.1 DNA translocase FtsK [Weissella uvarum]